MITNKQNKQLKGVIKRTGYCISGWLSDNAYQYQVLSLNQLSQVQADRLLKRMEKRTILDISHLRIIEGNEQRKREEEERQEWIEAVARRATGWLKGA